MGEATIVFTNDELKKHKLISNYGGSSVRIAATVVEDLTDIKRNASTQVTNCSHKIENKYFFFKRGKKYLNVTMVIV